jgi:hypothetical protein
LNVRDEVKRDVKVQILRVPDIERSTRKNRP